MPIWGQGGQRRGAREAPRCSGQPAGLCRRRRPRRSGARRPEDGDLTGVRRRPGPTAYSSITVPRDGAKSIVLALNANDEWADDADAVRDDVRGAPAGSVVVVDLEVPELLARAALEAAREQNLRSEEHTSELQSLMRISYAVF